MIVSWVPFSFFQQKHCNPAFIPTSLDTPYLSPAATAAAAAAADEKKKKKMTSALLLPTPKGS